MIPVFKEKKSPALLFAGLFFMFQIILSGCSTRDCMGGSSGILPDPHVRIPVYEIFPAEDSFPEIEDAGDGQEPRYRMPSVAIIIDDIGYDTDITERFLELDAVITFSLFPHSPDRENISRKIQAKGMEMMLHLPMEPVEYPSVSPGPGALLLSMSSSAFASQLAANLDSIRGIKGVNNHMGSALTAMPALMYRVLAEVKKRNLFFIDSFTSTHTVCPSTARLLQIPFAQRDVFLDHVQDPETIRRQIRRLIRIAENYGEAVGIGHPHKSTVQVLAEELPEMQKRVRLVPVSRIVHTIG